MKAASRILVAIGAFTALLSIVVIYFSLNHGKTPNIQTSTLDDISSNSTDTAYTSIGDTSIQYADPEGNTSFANELFTLELSLVRSRQDAEKSLASFEQKGVSVYYTPMNNNGQVIYRVRYGTFSNERIASAAAEKLAKEKAIQGKVVRLN